MRNQVLERISDCQERLEEKKEELEALVERHQGVVAEFDQLAPENNQFREPLFKVFFKKIKRSRKRMDGGDDEEYDSEEEDDDDDFDEDDDEEEETCPEGCDQVCRPLNSNEKHRARCCKYWVA